MDATKLIISDLISLSRSGNIQATTFRWDTAGTETVTLTTRDLVRLFGIPDKKKLALLRIRLRGSAAGFINITIDPKLKGQNQGAIQDFEDPVMGRVPLAVEAAEDMDDVELFGMNCVDELVFNTGDTGTWRLTFIYELIPGEMFFLDDLIENIGDIRQVEIDRTEGQEWFQLGPVTQINEGTGEDIE